jgi:ech hydrogenase subunit D
MMDHEYMDISLECLVQEVLKVKHDGYRLVQISATRTDDGFELLYSFGLEHKLLCLRINVQENSEVMSISDIYSPAFLYENEIHDLFGVQIKLITIDYNGNFYRMNKATPFK